LLNVISIVETILDLLSPSRGGISTVPMAILLNFKVFNESVSCYLSDVNSGGYGLASCFQSDFFHVGLGEACYDRQNVAHRRSVSHKDNISFSVIFFTPFLWLALRNVTFTAFVL
jgi:hypothetical protein